ncbi:MAG: Hsp20/alpha crystallin family protein [Candidatus Spechtbacterales bacterium]|nr:Hsp20/alpha crystallin family protein [Candidatus Spechtbacterales bacterium]
MSFLQRLKGNGIDTSAAETETEKKTEEQELKGVAEVAIDLYETDDSIIIYAPVPGADVEETQVSVEGDNDVLVIHGQKKRPEEVIAKDGKVPEGRFFSQDAEWGEFYRRVILPEQIDVKKAKVKMKNGILIMTLPLQKTVAQETHTLKIETISE